MSSSERDSSAARQRDKVRGRSIGVPCGLQAARGGMLPPDFVFCMRE